MNTPASNPSEYHITLLRHAESVGNAEGYYQGQSDFPLTEEGKGQSYKLAEHWLSVGKTYDLVISSPLSRSRQTAEIIASLLKLSLYYDPVWMERDAGLLSGLHENEAENKYPRPEFVSIYHPIGATGESQWDLYLRAGSAVRGLLQRPPGSYLVVSHGAILNMVLYAMLGIFPQANFQGPHFNLRNTSYANLIYYPEIHVWSLECFAE